MGDKTRLKESNFSIVFIGTSSGKTSLKRFHSSLLIKSKSFNLLVDCGDGASKSLLARSIDLSSIDGILFSHLHPDHSAGFPSIIVQMKQLKRKKPLKVFCHANLTNSLKIFLKYSFVFTEQATFKLEYQEFEHEEKIKISPNFKFTSKQNSHLDKYLKYLADKTGFACSSFLFELGKKKVLYSGDVSSVQDLYLYEKENPKSVITEAAHISWEEILEYDKKMKPEKIYLTHYSDELGKELKGKAALLPAKISKKIILAADGLSIDF